jgi:hypothetical protein
MRTTTTISLAVLLLFAPAFADEDAGDKKYTAEELEEIVGPVALYPDQVLASVLPATAVPLDVVKASRWLAQQQGEVEGAPEDSGWDGSVQALVQFPDVLQWMNENPDWMEQMGYAVSVQQEDVLAAIQGFRKKSKDAGNLESNDKQQVIVEQETQIIQVQPAQPEVIYVPQYNPVYVTQPAASYPPSYPGTFFAGFAAGAIGAWAVHEIRWGGHSHPHYGHYGGGGLYVNNSPTFNFNKNGQINRVSGARVNSGTAWRSKKTAAQLPARAPRARGGAVARPRTPTWNQRRSPARPAKGGMRAPQRRPTQGARPRPAPGGGRRPTPAPGVRPGAGGRPSFGAGGADRRPGGGAAGGQKRPATRPSGGRQASQHRPDRNRAAASNRSSFGGSRTGASAHRNSQRGRSSMGSSRSRSSGGRASSGGRSRGGGGRGRR